MDQGGLYKAILYENIGISYQWNNDNSIGSISTSGETISLDNCALLNYKDTIKIGDNRKLVHDHRLDFAYFELNSQVLEDIETINSIYGWIVHLFFLNGNQFVLTAPLFFPEELEFETNQTNKYNFELITQQLTPIKLIKYETLGEEILSEDGDSILSELGDPFLTG